MPTRDEIYQAIRNADKAGDTESVQKLGAYLNTMDAPAPQAPSADRPGVLESMAAGAGRKFGNTVLGAQKLVGRGVQAVDSAVNGKSVTSLVTGQPSTMLGKAGQWLVNDAEQGQANLNSENAPYLAAHPAANNAGQIASDVVVTYPVGGLLAKSAKAFGASAPVVNALASGGMSGGGNLLTRSLAGAATGGASAAIVDPEHTLAGAAIGGAIPGVVKAAGIAGQSLADYAKSSANKLMQSALKPTIAQLRSGEADTAVQTLLSYGISPNKAGVEKLRGLIQDKNQEIADAIQNSGATVSKQNVLQSLGDVRAKFSNQVSPTSDLNAIQSVADDFASHPSIPGNDIPVQQAQEMKQGTYRVLAKKYGQMGSADIEAQKGLARGLKNEIASAVPEVGPLNAEESRLIATLNVSERRALMDLNKNPLGLSTLAKSPAAWAAFMADRSPAFKALAARAVNSLSGVAGNSGGYLQNALQSPASRNALQFTSGRALENQQ